MSKEKSFLGKHWSNILFVVILLLILIPQTRSPIQVMLNRLVAMSPSEIDKDERQVLRNYNWPLSTSHSELVNLSRSKNRVILLNYWATWCAPCIAELPDLEDLYEDYKDEIDFYFVSSEDSVKVNSFLKQRQSSIPVYFPMASPPEVLKSNSLPTTFLIDSNGEIIIKKVGAANWNSKSVKATIDKLK